MMEHLVEKATNWVASNARSPLAWTVGGLLAGGLCLEALNAFDVSAVTLPKLAVSLVVWVVAALCIRQFGRHPRAPKRCLGVLIALRCDDAEHARKIDADFVTTLRHLLHDGPGTTPNIRLVVYTPKDAADLTDAAAVRRAMDESRCHLAIWGQARVRLINRERTHVLSVCGLVRHARVDAGAQRYLSAHFNGVLPEHILLSEDGDVFKFQIASQHVDAAARYLMGLAALASNDWDTSERLLRDAHARAGGALADGPMRRIFEGSAEHLGALYVARCRRALTEWQRTHDRAVLDQAASAAEQALQFTPTAYDALLAGALCAFETLRDIARAHVLLRRCGKSKIKHAAWRYSTAFLYAYAGDLDRAAKEYGRAFKAPPQDRLAAANLARECVVHTTRVLSDEPDRFTLDYAIARIAAGPLQDMALASDHARAFCVACPPGAYPSQRSAMQALVRGQVVPLAGAHDALAPTGAAGAATTEVPRRGMRDGNGRDGEAA